MDKYLELCQYVLDNGVKKTDRTNTGTLSVFGYQTKYNLDDGFPLVTTKKVYLRAIIHELLWFMKGDTNIKYLLDNNVNIWNEWPYEVFVKSKDYNNETIEEFTDKIKTDREFATKHGELGPVYGKQWRNFNGVDQLSKVIESIKVNPDSRRHIISAWDPSEVDSMALPPCHAFMQFYVEGDELSLQLYQRSGDIFLGVPFNIASYALLLMIIAKLTNLKAKTFVHTIGDAHIYSNHIEQIKLQLSRKPYKLPEMTINPDLKSIDDLEFSDFELLNYKSHARIKGKVAV